MSNVDDFEKSREQLATLRKWLHDRKQWLSVKVSDIGPAGVLLEEAARAAVGKVRPVDDERLVAVALLDTGILPMVWGGLGGQGVAYERKDSAAYPLGVVVLLDTHLYGVALVRDGARVELPPSPVDDVVDASRQREALVAAGLVTP
jgi:hypothetical protein